MSTRCQVIIRDEGWGKKPDEQWFYRHSDGYPSGALPSLVKFMKWVIQGKIRDNVEQASGWLVLIGAKEYEEAYVGDGKYKKKEDLTTPSDIEYISGWKCGAYEPCPSQHKRHGDIDYLYTLDLDKKTIKIEDIHTKKVRIMRSDNILREDISEFV